MKSFISNSILLPLSLIVLLLASCQNDSSKGEISDNLVIDRADYAEKLHGFWLGTCIANWTGLVTEMDKIGNVGEIKTGEFYTRENWGQPDQPSIWGEGQPSKISPTIDFVLMPTDSIWGADDDTDIEYIYQELMLEHKTTQLTGEQIQKGWLKHIKSEEENYLWVSNQKALDLMGEGMVPPQTSEPENNPEYEMIDAQLTTEIFGLFAPGKPKMAVEMAHLPIRTTAKDDSEWISKFYVSIFSLATIVDAQLSNKEKILWMADQSKNELPKDSYAHKMYEYVKELYEKDYTWEQARDSIYVRYQVNQMDGYDITSKNVYCNGCFAAGINFAASLVSLFYGEGDFKETVKIGSLAGWDSDNPTATWGGLIGFMIGEKGIDQLFNQPLSNRYNIHRTRVGFANDGIDTFESMANKGLEVIDRVVVEKMNGKIDAEKNTWVIPKIKMGS